MSYIYTAIGDSLTTGFGAWPGYGFVPVYRRMAEAKLGHAVICRNLGVNGLNSSQLDYRLNHDQVYREAVKSADIVTVTIGGNDLLQASRKLTQERKSDARILSEALETCKHNYEKILNTITQLKGDPRRAKYVLRAAGVYNPYAHIREGNEWVIDFNRYAGEYAQRNYGFADIYPPFAARGRELLSIDRLHPNGRGYRIIAETVNRLGYKPF